MGIRERMMATRERRYVEHDNIYRVGKVCLQSLTEGERQDLEYLAFKDCQGKTEEELMEQRARTTALTNARLIQRSLVSVNKHKREFTDSEEDTKAILEMDSKTISQLGALIDQHCFFNPLTDAEETVAAKNSETTDDGILPMSSQETAVG